MKQYFAFFLTLLTLVSLGCKDTSVSPSDPTQNGDVSLSFAKAPAGIAQITATVSRANYDSQSLTLTVSDSGASARGTFHSLVKGYWHLKVDAKDTGNVVRYSAETDVQVIGGTTTRTQLNLLATTGDLEILVTWGGIDSTVASAGMLLHLTFDSTLTDASGNGNNATSSQASYTTDHLGQPGKAFLFDGVSNYLTVQSSNSLNPANQVSIAAWIRVDAVPYNYMPLFMKGGPATADYANRSYGVLLKYNVSDVYPQMKSAGDGMGQHELTDIGGGNPTDAFYIPGQWVHVVYVVDRMNHQMLIYTNGDLSRQTSDSYSSINASANPLMIGYSQEGLVETVPFKGAIDDFRIYGKALSASEIQALYASSN